MPDLILLADDLTGAADTAAPFAGHGIPARLILDRSARPKGGVTALSTESRDAPAPDAMSAVHDACVWVRHCGMPDAMLFKKIDSTLRGHVSDELDVVIKQYGIDRILLTPAFPAQGRTTRSGRQLVRGAPLARSGFGVDRDDLIALFEGVGGLPVVHHSLEAVRGDPAELAARMRDPGIHIPDIEADDDLDRCVAAGLDSGMTRFCGAGGLGRALAARLDPDSKRQCEPVSLKGPVLFVAGSRNQATLDQVAAADNAGVPAVPLSDRPGDAARAVVDHIHNRRNTVLSSTSGGSLPDDPKEIRRGLATAVRQVISSVWPGVILLTGGDIAAAVCRELGVTAIDLRSEVEPGIPIGLFEAGQVAGLPVVTKAGGFGDPETFLRVIASARRD